MLHTTQQQQGGGGARKKRTHKKCCFFFPWTTPELTSLLPLFLWENDNILHFLPPPLGMGGGRGGEATIKVPPPPPPPRFLMRAPAIKICQNPLLLPFLLPPVLAPNCQSFSSLNTGERERERERVLNDASTPSCKQQERKKKWGKERWYFLHAKDRVFLKKSFASALSFEKQTKLLSISFLCVCGGGGEETFKMHRVLEAKSFLSSFSPTKNPPISIFFSFRSSSLSVSPILISIFVRTKERVATSLPSFSITPAVGT